LPRQITEVEAPAARVENIRIIIRIFFLSIQY
jgi:hypothetical protein